MTCTPDIAITYRTNIINITRRIMPMMERANTALIALNKAGDLATMLPIQTRLAELMSLARISYLTGLNADHHTIMIGTIRTLTQLLDQYEQAQAEQEAAQYAEYLATQEKGA